MTDNVDTFQFGDDELENVYDIIDDLILKRRAPKSGPIWLTQMAEILRAVGLNVIEYGGWETRARSSGGYSDWPLCVMWHHTASNPSSDGQSDADYIAYGSPDAPISNLYIDRYGFVWVIAAGATNTNGKGNAISFSRGSVPADGMNSRALGVEMANNGVGEIWPQVQIDAMFTVSNVLNAWFGNRPDDISTHQFYAPDRKIDPATANAVSGPWKPTGINSSGSWSREDIQNECWNRIADIVPPVPPEESGMSIRIFESQTTPKEFNAVFFAYVDSAGRSIELQWSGDGDDPRVQERLETMRNNFETEPILLAGIKNNRLHPKHKPADINDSLHRWTDEDFAP